MAGKLGFLAGYAATRRRTVGRRMRVRAEVNPLELARMSIAAMNAGIQGKTIADVMNNRSDEALEEFCRLKGMRKRELRRSEMIDFVERYVQDEALSRTLDNRFEALGEKEKIQTLNRVCNAEGIATYVDPATGYTVFSSYAHLKRGNCCGVKEAPSNEKGYTRSHRCRHCPYSEEGSLVDTNMIELWRRVPTVEAVRTAVEAEMDVLRTGLDEKKSPAKPAKATEECEKCDGTSIVVCTRCSGVRVVFSPVSRLCPQCEGQGTHPCMSCSAWRPKAFRDFKEGAPELP